MAALASSIATSSFTGVALPSLSVKKAVRTSRSLNVQASSKKTVTKTPNGPSGDSKYNNAKDASGSTSAKGKGVYQFTKKYGANVDGYSPIWTPDEWSAKGSTYEGGVAGLALWAVTFAALLGVGVILVYSTSALS